VSKTIDWTMPTRKNLKYRIMYIENKSYGLEGDARIGKVYFSKSGKSLYYKDKKFSSLKGQGYKANYYDVDTLEEYWISGVRKDENNRLYGGNRGVEIDEDIKEEYYKIIGKVKDGNKKR